MVGDFSITMNLLGKENHHAEIKKLSKEEQESSDRMRRF
jgi:hypothetical protein